jgi:NADP-dependent 3-hydroxy acid dehydrogenase YdfG
MSKVIVISGAGSGFGALSARALADAGNTVYASARRPAATRAGSPRPKGTPMSTA